jgi:cytosine deaminase
LRLRWKKHARIDEGDIPTGAAIFNASGSLIGAGHNRRVQNGDPSLHGETDAFRNAGCRQPGFYRVRYDAR